MKKSNPPSENLPKKENILPKDIESEMQQSYLDYAMSVIVARALPDVRDGLKPVHRRILYAMNDMGLTSGAKFRKSATVVGEVLGKYHPHGDIAVYDTLVRLAQDFSVRYQLIKGQGNFGSLDGDPAAAQRYTEAKLASISDELLADINKNTVDFVPNYDSTKYEPSVLPSKIPNLLLNGSMGIAVGMATNIPPHNLGEVIDGLIYIIDHPDCSIDELIEIIPGPDFPTGGNIYNIAEIKNAYATGKGRILMRGKAEIVEDKKENWQIVISEIPYQVNKAELVTKIAQLVKDKKIEGIADLRDESDRKEGVRVVLDLKSSAYPKKILNRLFDLTQLQLVFHVNMLALIDGLLPRVLTLKDILDQFIAHRKIVVKRRTEFDLKNTKVRIHILEGLKLALANIDAIVKTIKESKNREDAAKNLITKFKLSPAQTDAILQMQLATLAALERERIENELKEKIKLAEKLTKILSSEQEILKVIKDELLETKNKFSDDRRTRIFKQGVSKFEAEDLIPNEQTLVVITKDNYIKRVPTTTYKVQFRGGKGVMGLGMKEEDFVEKLLSTNTLNDIMFFTNKGRVFTTKVYELPSSNRQSKGKAIVNLINISPDEKVTAVISQDSNEDKHFVMVTLKGMIKKTEISAYKNIRKTGIIAIKLLPDDQLRWVKTTSGQDSILLASKDGLAIHFHENEVRPMGRAAFGVRGIRLRASDELVTMAVAKDPNANILVVLENGLGKKTSVSKFHLQKRGGLGMKVAKVTQKTGKVVYMQIVEDKPGDAILVSKAGQMIRIPHKSIKKLNRDTQGIILMRLKGNDKVATVSLTYAHSTGAVSEIVLNPQEDKTTSTPTDKKIVQE